MVCDFMKKDCFGDKDVVCTVLMNQDCNACRFFATRDQYYANQRKSNALLRKKGLKTQIKMDVDGVMIMSTQEI